MKSIVRLQWPLHSLCLALSLTPLASLALTEGDYTYTVANGQATITDFNAMYAGPLSIADTLGGFPVTIIGSSAFAYCANLTSVAVPNSVSNIMDRAFTSCSNMTSITLPCRINSIALRTFINCTSLVSVTIPDSVTSIGNNAFNTCLSLTTLTIPSSVVSLGNNVFSGSTNLTAVCFCGNKPSLGTTVFDGDNRLTVFYLSGTAGWGTSFGGRPLVTYATSGGRAAIVEHHGSCIDVVIPETLAGLPVTDIGEWAFEECYTLASVTMPNSVTNIGEYAFYYCDSLTHVALANGLVSISEGAFWDCYNLASIIIPDSVVSIGYGAFEGSGLTSIIIPDSVVSLGQQAFSGCQSLLGFTLSSGLTSLGSNTFNWCSSLTNFALPNSITNIGYAAFNRCSSLTDIRLPNSVAQIGANAFWDCTSVTNVTIPNSVISIGDAAFADCQSLITVTIPSSVTRIEGCPFSYCSSLAAILVDEPNSFYSSVDGVLFNEAQTELIQCPCAKTGSYTIPSGVTNVAYAAFQGCASVTGVTVPSSVTHMSDELFNFCDDLATITVSAANPVYCSVDGILFNKSQTELIKYPDAKAGGYTIPGSVTRIGNNAFCHCWYLDRITIGNSVTSIGHDAFRLCMGLTSLTIPDSVTSIGDRAFGACQHLKNVTLGKGVTSIGDHMFEVCNDLTDITIPNTVTNLGACAFISCYQLKNVTIGSNVVSIGSAAFESCRDLVSITIPASVTSIGRIAFSGCNSLTGVYFEGNAPDGGDDPYMFSYTDNATVYYLPWTTGWGSTFGGRPTALWMQSVTTGVATDISATAATLAGTANPNGIATTAWFEYGLTEDYGNTVGVTLNPDNGTSAQGVSASLTGLQPGATYHYRLVAANAYGSAIGDDATFTTANTLTQGDYTFVVTNGTATIIGFNPAYVGILSVTNTLGGYPVTSIGTNVFWHCVGLTCVTIPNSIVTIGANAFADCPELGSVVIGSGVTNIGFDAFTDCTSLMTFSVDALNAEYSSIDGVLFNKSQTTLLTCPCGKTGVYAIPLSVTAIDDYAFYCCYDLEAVDIPNSVTNIGEWAFCCCYSLAGIRIPAGVAMIRHGTFWACIELSSITIPDSVTNIEYWAFSHCFNLLSVAMPDSVSSVGFGAFMSCHAMTNITLSGRMTMIDSQTFDNCSCLTCVTIPGSVTDIGYATFADCSSLTAVYFKGNPPSVDSMTFDGTTNATVYRLAGATGWPTVPGTWGGRPTALWIQPVTTGAATNITAITANLTGTVCPDGFTTTAWFEYGLTDNYGNTAGVVLIPDDGTTEQAVSAALAGLQPATTYHYRLAITNWLGAVFGDDATFTTASVTATPIPVPFAWLDQYPVLLSQEGGDYEAAALADADGDGYAAWQEYVAGSNPTNAASVFIAVMAMSNGVPWVTWTPDLGEARVYTVEGRTNLTQGVWGTTNAGCRFFRVRVGMP